MRVGVDGACWANARGYGRFTRELLGALVRLSTEDQFVFFADPRAAEAFDLPHADNTELITVDQRASPTQAASADGHRAVSDMLRFTRAVHRTKLDVFFSPSVYTYFPLPLRLPAVVAVHDTIAERHPALTLPTRRARLFWRSKVRLALWQTSLVVTVSEFSAGELHEVLRVPSRRIRVVGEAPASVFRPADDPDAVASAARRVGLAPGDRWIVYVGGFGPHKNLDAAVRAHATAVRQSDARVHLLLVGALDGDPFYGNRSAIDAAIVRAGTGQLVRWTGYLPDEDLSLLLAGAVALLLPSEREGFGLPAVEAAACGTPVVATTCSPLPELLAGGGFFIEPGDESALADAITRLATDDALRAAMGRRALEATRSLSWPRAARATLDAIREVA